MAVRTFRNSEIKAFMDCPRNWWLQYHRKLRRKPVELPEGVDKAEQGTSYHAYLNAHYQGEDVTLMLQGEPDKLVKRMVEGYLEWLAETGVDQGLEIVAVERKIEVPFGTVWGDEVFINGTLDLEVVDEWGFPKIIDHKTVQSLNQADLLYINFQGRTYSLLRQLEGAPVAAFVHNQARRVMRTASANPPFYNRVEVAYNARVLDAHEVHVRAIITKMVQAAQMMEQGLDHHALLVPNPTKDCSWRCPFVQVCPMFDDGSDAEGYLEDLFTDAGTLDHLEEGEDD